jgi:lipopolysaccharide biosynthesis glycosyltransferase
MSLSLIISLEKKYTSHLRLLWSSLSKSTSEVAISRCYFLCYQLASSYKQQIERFIGASSLPVEVVFIEVPSNPLAQLKTAFRDDSSSQLAALLCGASLLPVEPRVLYLDMSTLVLGNLASLTVVDMDRHLVAGSMDEVAKFDAKKVYTNLLLHDTASCRYEQLARPGFFASSALLLNLSRWQTERHLEQFMEFFATLPNTTYRGCTLAHLWEYFLWTRVKKPIYLLPLAFNLRDTGIISKLKENKVELELGKSAWVTWQVSDSHAQDGSLDRAMVLIVSMGQGRWLKPGLYLSVYHPILQRLAPTMQCKTGVYYFHGVLMKIKQNMEYARVSWPRLVMVSVLGVLGMLSGWTVSWAIQTWIGRG